METGETAPAGIFGQHYFAQNKLGLYRSAAATATYKLHQTSQHVDIKTLIHQALRTVLGTHSPLSWGLTQLTPKSAPLFIRLSEIKLVDILKFHDIDINDDDLEGCDGLKEGSFDEKAVGILTERLNIEHEEIWTDTDVKPIWRCVVLNYAPKSVKTSVQRFDIIFIYHHAIADGLSGLTFHQTLQKALNAALSSTSSEIETSNTASYMVPEDIKPPTLIEDLVLLNLDIDTSPNSKIGDDDFWTASPPSLSTPYKSKTKLLTIPAGNLTRILKFCRENSLTVTALLHGLLITTLSQHLPEAKGFRALTPYSLRPFIPSALKPESGKEEISCSISYMTSEFNAALFGNIKDPKKGLKEELDLVKEIGRKFRGELEKELEAVQQGNVSPLISIHHNLLKKDITYEEHCRSSLGKKRSHTYELSNIREFIPTNFAVEGKLELNLEKVIFTQCGMVTGAAIGCSVVSTRDGPLVAGFTWQEGVVETEFMGSIIEVMRKVLTGL